MVVGRRLGEMGEGKTTLVAELVFEQLMPEMSIMNKLVSYGVKIKIRGIKKLLLF